MYSSKFKSKPNLKNTVTYQNPVTKKKSNRLQLENILKKKQIAHLKIERDPTQLALTFGPLIALRDTA